MRRLAVVVILLGMAASGYARAGLLQAILADGVAMGTLRADATEHDLYASFTLRGAFGDEIREQISTGLPITFTYYLEVARRRPLWFDRVLARRTITTTATYDTLTHQYSLSKRVNDEVAETSVAVSESEMMRWMTTLEHVRLADPTNLEGVEDDSLYVRVKSRLQRRFIMFFIPWDVETGWVKVRVSLSGEGTSRGD